MQVVTKNQLGDFTEKLLGNDKTLHDSLVAEQTTLKNDIDKFSKGNEEIKRRINNISEAKLGVNIFDKDNDTYTEHAQLSDAGTLQINSSWDSVVSDFFPVISGRSKTLRSTQAASAWVCEYTEDGTFVKKTKTFNSSNPLTLDNTTAKLRIMYYTSFVNFMIYQSDEVLPYAPYKNEEYIVANFNIPVDTNLTEKGVPADAYTIGKYIEDKEFEDVDVTNYMLFPHETYEKKYYKNGVLTTTADARIATSLVRLDKTKGILPMTTGNADVVFFDKDKKYISQQNAYRGLKISPSDIPENAVYVAFSCWTNSIIGSSFWVGIPNVLMATEKIFPSILKKKGQRPIVNIYTTDSQVEIYEKLADAYYTQDCDVHFEYGTYTFDTIFEHMKTVYGRNTAYELPIGGNCRYYFHDATLISNNVSLDTNVTGNTSVMGSLRHAGSYELFDGNLISNNGIYVIHDEGSGEEMPYVRKYHNMRLTMNNDDTTNYINKCIGGGMGLHGHSIFDSCVMKTNKMYGSPLKPQPVLSFHGCTTGTVDNPAYFRLDITNCYIEHNVSLDGLTNDDRYPNCTAECLYAGNSSDTAIVKGSGWTVYDFNNEIRNS